MTISASLRRWLLLIALGIIWGSTFLIIKVTLTGFSAPTLVFGRLVIGFMTLVPLALAFGVGSAGLGTALPLLTACALVGNALPFTLIAWGQTVVPSGIAGIFMAVMPLVVILLAHVFIPSEPLTRSKAVGFVLGFFGIVVLLGPDAAASGSGGALLHQAAVLGGALAYAVNAIISRRLPPLNPLAVSAAVLLIAALMLAPFALPQALTELRAAPAQSVLSLVALGTLSTGLATVIYFEIIRRAGASFFALVNYLIPVWAAFLGATLGGEALGLNALIALSLVLGGVWLSQRRPRLASM